MRRPLLALATLLVALPAVAEEPEAGGVLNPEEMTLDSYVGRAAEGEADMMLCASGYLATKSGRHAMARTIFGSCAEAGWTAAMTWMSQLDDNGLAAPEDPEAAARWSRRAAEAGDPVGAYNYGLALLRGRGVPQDFDAGREWVERAAEAGLDSAEALAESGYDLGVATPDADNWKYAPVF